MSSKTWVTSSSNDQRSLGRCPSEVACSVIVSGRRPAAADSHSLNVRGRLVYGRRTGRLRQGDST
jgi:hypothetical protein